MKIENDLAVLPSHDISGVVCFLVRFGDNNQCSFFEVLGPVF